MVSLILEGISWIVKTIIYIFGKIFKGIGWFFSALVEIYSSGKKDKRIPFEKGEIY